MIRHIAATVAMTIAATVAALSAAPSAHAEDQRPCVSHEEFKGTLQSESLRHALEAEWEVSGLGWALGDLPGFSFGNYYTAIAYPRCGYSVEESWYAVLYSKRTRHVVGVATWTAVDATAHGHLRSR